MRKELLDGEQVFVVHDFLTAAECERFVAVTEDAGYTAAPITTAYGPVMRADVCNNQRVVVDSFAWAEEFAERGRPFQNRQGFDWWQSHRAF